MNPSSDMVMPSRTFAIFPSSVVLSRCSSERQALPGERLTELCEGVRPDAMQVRELGLADRAELLKAREPSIGECPARRLGQLVRPCAGR
jgi:hypothetical protein